MNKFGIYILTLYCIGIQAQDSYHSELIATLQSEYNLDIPEYVLDDTEQENINATYVYGNSSRSTNEVSDLDFSIISKYTVPSAGNNAWDSGTGVINKTSIEKDDIILMAFWAKKTSEDSELFIFIEDGNTFDKEFYETISLTPDWNRYFIAFKASKNYAVGGMAMGFHLATMQQTFELAGLTALNFGEIDIEGVPSSFSTGAYEGIESDAPWRALAEERIETLRKADLTVNVKSSNGNLIENAEVKVEMLKHKFGFGSALVTCRFQGNDCYDATYVEKLQNLDGEGHGFNVGVTENALKWDGWEEEWLGSPDETAAAIQYLADNGIEMRGHTLFWPGYNMMPDDIVQNKNDLDYLRNRIAGRIDEMINHPVLSQHIREWDVLNEITTNRDIELAFKNDPNFDSGREIYQEIIKDVKTIDPDVKLYVNDYIVLSGGGSGSNVVDRYMSYLDEMHESDNGFDGIGFQGHIGSNPTSILKLESVWNEFYERYGKPLKVTEYDVNELVDPEIQASYMKDFLTMTFSHPAMEAFIMWGFWDGNHWKGNAPMFDMQWNLKLGGQAFIDKVFKDWWTNENSASDANGSTTIRGFKGKYKVSVTVNGVVQEKEVDLFDDDAITFDFENTSKAVNELNSKISIVPNIIDEDYFIIQYPIEEGRPDVKVYDTAGKVAFSQNEVAAEEKIMVNLSPGNYYVNISFGAFTITEKIVVQ